ncbi:Transcriptional adapter 1 [Balamuthia mandrillaris]
MDKQMAGQRVDLLEAKKTLSLSLGDKAPEYWKHLKAYTQARLTKWELDCLVFSLLGEDKGIGCPSFYVPLRFSSCNTTLLFFLVKLHNNFIKAIIRNAYTPRPLKPLPISRKRPPMGLTASPPSKRTKTRAAPKEPFIRNPLLRTHRVTSRHPVRTLTPTDYLRLANDCGGLPSLLALRNRIYKTALEHGLSEVSGECVTLMMHALEHHIKDVLEIACQRKGGPMSGSPSGRRSGRHRTLALRDLMAAIQTTPRVLGEDLPVNQERILLMQK